MLAFLDSALGFPTWFRHLLIVHPAWHPLKFWESNPRRWMVWCSVAISKRTTIVVFLVGVQTWSHVGMFMTLANHYYGWYHRDYTGGGKSLLNIHFFAIQMWTNTYRFASCNQEISMAWTTAWFIVGWIHYGHRPTPLWILQHPRWGPLSSRWCHASSLAKRGMSQSRHSGKIWKKTPNDKERQMSRPRLSQNHKCTEIWRQKIAWWRCIDNKRRHERRTVTWLLDRASTRTCRNSFLDPCR